MQGVIPKIIGTMVLVSVTGLSSLLWLANKEIDSLKAAAAVDEIKLGTCQARVNNIQADRKSDAQVLDPRNFTVPDDWMFRP